MNFEGFIDQRVAAQPFRQEIVSEKYKKALRALHEFSNFEVTSIADTKTIRGVVKRVSVYMHEALTANAELQEGETREEDIYRMDSEEGKYRASISSDGCTLSLQVFDLKSEDLEDELLYEIELPLQSGDEDHETFASATDYRFDKEGESFEVHPVEATSEDVDPDQEYDEYMVIALLLKEAVRHVQTGFKEPIADLDLERVVK